jgi:hypothetical protein
VLDRSVLPTQVQIGALLLLLRLLWLPDLSERLQVYCVLMWLLCSAVLERQKRSRFEFRVVDHFLTSAVSLHRGYLSVHCNTCCHPIACGPTVCLGQSQHLSAPLGILRLGTKGIRPYALCPYALCQLSCRVCFCGPLAHLGHTVLLTVPVTPPSLHSYCPVYLLVARYSATKLRCESRNISFASSSDRQVTDIRDANRHRRCRCYFAIARATTFCAFCALNPLSHELDCRHRTSSHTCAQQRRLVGRLLCMCR